jgi:flagellar protein FlgJ
MNHVSSIPSPLLDLQSAAAAQSATPYDKVVRGNERKAREAAQSFESVFLFEVLQSMYADVKPGPFSGGSAEGIYRSMMNEEIAKSISRQGGIGIADSVFREIMRQQEV